LYDDLYRLLLPKNTRFSKQVLLDADYDFRTNIYQASGNIVIEREGLGRKKIVSLRSRVTFAKCTIILAIRPINKTTLTRFDGLSIKG
jgi:hypothetical protein